MTRKLLLNCFLVFFSVTIFAQQSTKTISKFRYQSFGLQAGLTLLENPLVFYPVVNFSYSKPILGKGKHQLALLPQLGIVFLPQIETKFLFSGSLQYKYVAAKRFEATVFAGIDYQLRRLAYDRFAYAGTELKNKGRFLHQVGPIMGMTISYKIIKQKSFSISPNLGISFIKINKNYQPDITSGYKPFIMVGVNFNK